MDDLDQPIGFFADRYTSLLFGDYLPSVTQPWISVQREAAEMCHGAAAVIDNAILNPNIGWQISSYHQNPGDWLWLEDAQPGILTPANANVQVGGYMIEAAGFAQQPIPGGAGYGSGVQSVGTPFLNARYPSSETNWANNNLAADQAAFPGANTSEDLSALDRVLVSQPGKVNPWDTLTLLFWPPGSLIGSRAGIDNFYFNGPAGSDAAGQADANLLGTGQYELKVRGDGRAYLYELLANQTTWQPRFSFQWRNGSGPVSSAMERITIKSRMWQDADGNYLGDRITFQLDGSTISPGHYGLLDVLAGMAQARIRTITGDIPVYNVPRITDVPTTICPVRVDLARDCRASFCVARHLYLPSATITDDFIALDYPITDDPANGHLNTAVYLYLEGVLPTACSWTCAAIDEYGNPYTLLSVTNGTTASGQYTVFGFQPTAGSGTVGPRYIQASFTLNSSSDQTQTPTITGYEIDRSTVYQTLNPVTPTTIPSERGDLPALLKNAIVSFAINPQEADPSAENATFVVVDYTNELEFLQNVNMLPIAAFTTYDGTGKLAPLFRGYILTARRQIKPSTMFNVYPATDWSFYTLSCVGEWARTSEVMVPNARTWVDPETGAPFRATDVIDICACTVYPPTMVDVPDIDVSIFTTDAEAYTAQYGTRVVDIMQQMCDDFLGSYMIFDEAADTQGNVPPRGMLRMLEQKTAPYNNLAIFEIEHPTTIAGDSVPRVPQWVAAYGTTTVSGQIVQSLPILRGTVSSYREKSEANQVTVIGGGVAENAQGSGAQDGAMYTQTIFNQDSYNFLNLPSTSPQYPDGSSPEYYGRVVPIKDVDFKLQTQAAVDWKARRIFEKACYSKFYMTFTAPMVLVTDVTDSKQAAPRRLRFYDAVQVRQNDGSLMQFLVVHFIPTYRKDGLQMGDYLLVSQANINTIGVIDRKNSNLATLRKALGRLTGGTHTDLAPVTAVAHAQAAPIATRGVRLPIMPTSAIQNLNGASSNLGEFVYTLGFDALGVAPIGASI